MKMDFRDMTIDDKEWVSKAFWEDGRKGCEFSFANNFLWGKQYHVQVASYCGCLLIRYERGGEVFYTFPCGNGDKKAALEAMIIYSDKEGRKLELTGLVKEETTLLEQWFPEQFEITTNRDFYDYIYSTQELTLLSGKKYHGKRNHIARFKDSNWSYEALSTENMQECHGMLQEWKKRRGDYWNEDTQIEFEVMQDAMEYFEKLELEGGVLRQNGKVVAFCIGEPLTEDTYVVHFEKAFGEVQGAYPMINQQFVEHNCQNYMYVNREEDAGEEGLRKAKLSYRPVILLEKYHAYLN